MALTARISFSMIPRVMKRGLFILSALLMLAVGPVPSAYADDDDKKPRKEKKEKKSKKGKDKKKKKNKKALEERLKGIKPFEGKAPKCKKRLLVYNFTSIDTQAEEALTKLAEEAADLKKLGMEVMLICHDVEDDEKETKKFIKKTKIKKFCIIRPGVLNNNISEDDMEELGINIPTSGAAILDRYGKIVATGDVVDTWKEHLDKKEKAKLEKMEEKKAAKDDEEKESDKEDSESEEA